MSSPSFHVDHTPTDPTSRLAILREYYTTAISDVDDICREVAGEYDFIMKASVVDGLPYEKLEARFGTLWLSRSDFYGRQRQFYYLLDSRRKHMFY